MKCWNRVEFFFFLFLRSFSLPNAVIIIQQCHFTLQYKCFILHLSSALAFQMGGRISNFFVLSLSVQPSPSSSVSSWICCWIKVWMNVWSTLLVNWVFFAIWIYFCTSSSSFLSFLICIVIAFWLCFPQENEWPLWLMLFFLSFMCLFQRLKKMRTLG